MGGGRNSATIIADDARLQSSNVGQHALLDVGRESDNAIILQRERACNDANISGLHAASSENLRKTIRDTVLVKWRKNWQSGFL